MVTLEHLVAVTEDLLILGRYQEILKILRDQEPEDINAFLYRVVILQALLSNVLIEKRTAA